MKSREIVSRSIHFERPPRLPFTGRMGEADFSTFHAGSRFPAFWGPNFDWVPDQDHGSVACLALQRMVLQADDGKIHLLPAWPKDWNVDFKLHTHGQTVVEGCWQNGKLEALTVLPAERRKDVISI